VFTDFTVSVRLMLFGHQLTTVRLHLISHRFQVIAGRADVRLSKASSFTHEFYFLSFYFYQAIALSSRVVDGHDQM